MKKIFNYLVGFSFIFSALTTMESCKKADPNNNITVVQTQAHFLFKNSRRCFVENPTDSFRIRIGLTSPSNTPTTVTLTTSSNTATEGVHYSLSRKTIVIPAGKVLDSFFIKPATVSAANDYINGRRDSVVITISSPGIQGLDFNKTFVVQLRERCDETIFGANDLDFLVGEYDRSYDDGNSASTYSASIKSYTIIDATSAEIKVSNLYNFFGADMRFLIDWSNTSNIEVKTLREVDQSSDIRDFGYNVTAGQFKAGIRPNSTIGQLFPCGPTLFLSYDIFALNTATGGDVTLAAFNNTTTQLERSED